MIIIPIGVIADVLAVAVGGLIGGLIGGRVSDHFKENLNLIFGCCAMGMGVSSIILMQNMPAVIFSIIIGTIIGLAVHLGSLVNKAAASMQKLVSKIVPYKGNLAQDDFNSQLVTMIVLFCASGTGIYGTLVSGMTGDHTVLLSKAILDIFTALIFACSLGYVISFIAIPQFVVLGLLYVLAIFLAPHTSDSMIADFRACGGFLLLATGFRIAKIRIFPIVDMLPAMILVMPVSALWTNFIAPLL